MQKKTHKTRVKTGQKKPSHRKNNLDMGLGVCKKCLKLFAVDFKKVASFNINSIEDLQKIVAAEKESCSECRSQAQL